MSENKIINNVEKKPWFSCILNYTALIILVSIIAVFVYGAFSFIKRTAPEKAPIKTSINFKLDAIQLKKNDTTLVKVNKLFIDSLNNKVQQLKEQIKTLNETKEYIDYIQNRNENDFRLLLIILGSVFAIVGFFGFKSINDVRESTIKNAKEEALKIAEKETERIATKEAIAVATKTAEKTAESETKKYLEENKGELFTTFEANITNTFQPQFDEINEKLDKVQNPFAFHENERPQVFTDFDNRIHDMELKFKKMQDDLINFQNNQYKNLLKSEIIEELKNKTNKGPK